MHWYAPISRLVRFRSLSSLVSSSPFPSKVWATLWTQGAGAAVLQSSGSNTDPSRFQVN